jgi:hypothetical protein
MRIIETQQTRNKEMAKNLTSENFPAAFAAMNAAAKGFWCYPDEDWQLQFLDEWAIAHNDSSLLEAVEVWK